MSQILGKSSNAKQPTAVGALNFQTSQRGGVIPLAYGTVKLAPNLLQYDDFTSTPVPTEGGGKGKGGGKAGQVSEFTYSASVIWGLCQGPIVGIGNIWENKSTVSLSTIGGTLHLGEDGQAIDSFWATNHAATSISYSGTAYISTPNLNIGTSASLPACQVETITTTANAGPAGYDAHPDAIISDFLTNPRYGAGFPIGSLAPLQLYADYCDTLLIALSPLLEEQRDALTSLDDITTITNSAIVWDGELLHIIPYGDSAVASSTVWRIVLSGGLMTAGASFEVTFTDATVPSSPTTVSEPTFQDEALNDLASSLANAIVLVVPDYQIVVSSVTSTTEDPDTGFSTSTILLLQQPSLGSTTVTVGVTGTPGGTITVTEATSAPGGGYTPDVTPVYDLTAEDFIIQETSVGDAEGLATGGDALRSAAGLVIGVEEDPIQVTRKSFASRPNNLKVEWIDRGNAYNVEIIEFWDQAGADRDGVRSENPFKARAICDPTVASICGQLAFNRLTLFPNEYTFKLGWKYILLLPMDIVTLTEPRLRMDHLPVRITSVVENSEGTLTITAEDFSLGYSATPVYPKQPGAGYNPNWNTQAGFVNPPVIFEPPASLAPFQVWIGISGSPEMGTAQAWISSDGSHYDPIGAIAPTYTGVVSAPLPAGAAIDTTNTLSVNLTESRGVLNSVSSSDAASLVTLCWVGDLDGTNGELLAYQTATLTGTDSYDLTTLYRGASGSDILAHANGSRFLFIDASPNVKKFAYPASWVGQTVYFKFTTSNLIGGGSQSLADVGFYPYTLTGGVDVAYPFFIESNFGTGTPTADQVVNPFPAGIPINFAPNFGSIAGATTVGRASVAATASTTFNVQKALAITPNTWANIGTVVYAAAGVIPTFTTAGSAAQSLALGDTVRIIAPTVPDATLAGVVIVLAGSR